MNPQDSHNVEVMTMNTLIEYAAHSVVSKIILKKPNGNVTLFAFDAGEELSEHTTPFDALVQVIDGAAEILIDGKSFLVISGASIIMPGNIPHAVKANVKFKMLLTMIK
ncbi:MAG: cupin domain-containing protein [Bacteriovoracaceae bacterium]|nr:cupin domain-containing protein [Bacteroidota bacterium]